MRRGASRPQPSDRRGGAMPGTPVLQIGTGRLTAGGRGGGRPVSTPAGSRSAAASASSRPSAPASASSRGRPRRAGPRSSTSARAPWPRSVPTGQLVDGWLSTSCATRRSCSNNLDGRYRHPERFSRRFAGQVVQARKALGEERLPVIRLHDLPHTHATLLLADGVPVRSSPSVWVTPAPPSRSPSTSTSTPAWAARRPTASRRCSRLIRGAKHHAGTTRATEAPTARHPGSWPAGTPE